MMQRIGFSNDRSILQAVEIFLAMLGVSKRDWIRNNEIQQLLKNSLNTKIQKYKAELERACKMDER